MANSSPWTSEEANALCVSRQALGLDLFQLAKLSSLSPQQLQELEAPDLPYHRSAFYSPEIKAHAGRKLLQRLSAGNN